MKNIFKIINFKKIKKNEINKFNDIFHLYICEITNQKKLRKDYFNLFNSNLKIFFIKKNNITIGLITFYLNKFQKIKSNNVYIRDFYIKERYRKNGLGKLSIDKIIKTYSKKKFLNFKIEIIKSNYKVIHFWKSLNFNKNKSFFIKKINDSH